MLVSSTKVPNFPAPGKDLKYYQDRYDNEPKYKEWFDKNFPGQTIEQVLVPQMGDKETKIPGFPDPEKDLQHYLDRYDNEPKYKEWFDKNFPGQTIEQVLVPQMGDKETKIPGFPDPEKDLQHYLDRYDNEPKYKEWFDKNFPGQTVREAVC
jgi:cytochrome c peroxidase